MQRLLFVLFALALGISVPAKRSFAVPTDGGLPASTFAHTQSSGLVETSVFGVDETEQDASIVSSSDIPVDVFGFSQTAHRGEEDQVITERPRRFSDVSRRHTRFGTSATRFAAVPGMMGDGFGAPLLVVPGGTHVTAGDHRFKIAENNSPVPRNRLFFQYDHFHNSIIDANGVVQNHQRYTLGMERTFLDDLASFEWRLPLSRTLDQVQQIGSASTMSSQAGNLGISIKAVLWKQRRFLLTGGTTLTIPTGTDYQFRDATNALLLDVDNDSVHIAPYLGLLVLGRADTFLQAFVQTDFDLIGDDVRTGAGFQGVLQQQNLWMVDLSLGRWIYRSRRPCRRLQAIALIGELHYTSTMNDADTVAGITNPLNRVDRLHATGALHVQLGKATIRVVQQRRYAMYRIGCSMPR